MRFWNRVQTAYRNHPSPAFLCGGLIGVLFFLWIYGVRILDVTYVDWLLHSNDIEGSIDLTQHYLGWEFYRRTPWQFPLGLTEGIYWDKVSVIYTDSIPLLAFMCKLLSPLLPTAFQYFGLWGLLCYTLLGGFGALLVRHFTKHPLFPVLASVFLVINPVLLNRMFLHSALSAHFLILCGLCLWAYRKSLSHRGSLLLWSMLLSCGALINAYFVPMLVITLCCERLEILLEETAFRDEGGASVPAALLCGLGAVALPCLPMIAACYVMGMFYGDVPSGAGGLEVLSFNLNSFLNPFTYLTDFGRHTQGYRDMNYSRLLPALPLSTAYQNEGFAYLGLGMLVLLAACVVIGIVRIIFREKNCTLQKSTVIGILAYVILFLFFALSPRATLGERALYDLPLPGFLHQLWSSFRSTARFIWPVYYLLVAGVFVLFACVVEHSKEADAPPLSLPRWLPLFLIGATMLQLYDLTPGFYEKRTAFCNLSDYETPLTSPLWEELGQSSTRIVFYPDTYYGLYLDKQTSMDFEIYALKYDLTLNNTYMSRDLCKQADAVTMEHFASRSAGASYPDIIYIFFDDADVTALPSTYHLNYYEIDGYIIGTEKDFVPFPHPFIPICIAPDVSVTVK